MTITIANDLPLDTANPADFADTGGPDLHAVAV